MLLLNQHQVSFSLICASAFLPLLLLFARQIINWETISQCFLITLYIFKCNFFVFVHCFIGLKKFIIFSKLSVCLKRELITKVHYKKPKPLKLCAYTHQLVSFFLIIEFIFEFLIVRSSFA